MVNCCIDKKRQREYPTSTPQSDIPNEDEDLKNKTSDNEDDEFFDCDEEEEVRMKMEKLLKHLKLSFSFRMMLAPQGQIEFPKIFLIGKAFFLSCKVVQSLIL